MIIQSASLHPKVGLNVQNCPQACKTWTADTHTHTRVHTDTHNLKQQYTQEAPGSQTKPGSLTFFGEMLDLLHPAVQCQPSNSRPASVPDWTLTSETQQCNIITEHYKETLPLSALYIWMHMNQLAVICGMHAVVWGHILVRICGVKLFCIQNIVWIWWGFYVIS